MCRRPLHVYLVSVIRELSAGRLESLPTSMSLCGLVSHQKLYGGLAVHCQDYGNKDYITTKVYLIRGPLGVGLRVSQDEVLDGLTFGNHDYGRDFSCKCCGIFTVDGFSNGSIPHCHSPRCAIILTSFVGGYDDGDVCFA